MFFLCKQMTAYEMRISDWSSDVCSSDLRGSGARTMFELLSATPGQAAGISPDEEVDDFLVYHNNHFPELEDAADALRGLIGQDDRITDTAIAARLESRDRKSTRLNSSH